MTYISTRDFDVWFWELVDHAIHATMTADRFKEWMDYYYIDRGL